MSTISEQLTQLESDREDFVDNLEAKGITGLSGDETFTQLVPEVLNIPSGGGGSPIEYITTISITEDTSVVNIPVDPSQYGTFIITADLVFTNSSGNTIRFGPNGVAPVGPAQPFSKNATIPNTDATYFPIIVTSRLDNCVLFNLTAGNSTGTAFSRFLFENLRNITLTANMFTTGTTFRLYGMKESLTTLV